MNFKIIILVVSLCINISFLNATHCDFQNYATCEHPQYIINRATGFYLGRGEVYNYNGLDVVLDYNYDKFCVSDCFITNTVNNKVLNIAEGNLEKRHVILWPISGSNGQNQVWDTKKEDTGFFSIRTELGETHLALASVDFIDASKGLTLVDYNAQDPQQQWTIQE